MNSKNYMVNARNSYANKKLPYYWILGILFFSHSSCTNWGFTDDSGTKVSVVDTIKRDMPMLAPPPDSSTLQKIETSVDSLSLILEATMGEIDSLKKRLVDLDEQEGHYVEGLSVVSFLGVQVEGAALELKRIDDNWVQARVDYFDGVPIGGRLFLIKNGALVALDIIQLVENITENGVTILDRVSHRCYYHKEHLLHVLDLLNQEPLMIEDFSWKKENWEDWKVIESYIEKF